MANPFSNSMTVIPDLLLTFLSRQGLGSTRPAASVNPIMDEATRLGDFESADFRGRAFSDVDYATQAKALLNSLGYRFAPGVKNPEAPRGATDVIENYASELPARRTNPIMDEGTKIGELSRLSRILYMNPGDVFAYLNEDAAQRDLESIRAGKRPLPEEERMTLEEDRRALQEEIARMTVEADRLSRDIGPYDSELDALRMAIE